MSSPSLTAEALSSGARLYSRAKTMIPGGTQLLSKRPENFLPGQWPSYYAKAQGATVWDLDYRAYVDFSYSGIGSCVLGYANPEVDSAVQAVIARGVSSTLNCPEEVELAELLLELHDWAERVRFARCGGEAMTIAVRIARAATGRDRIAFCGYHGWHDWYLSANLQDDRSLDGHLLPGLYPAGVPRALTGTALPFEYNHPEQLEAILSRYPDSIAAIVMEPIRHRWPQDGFLEKVRDLARRHGCVLVFDEITSGWRLNSGGVHLRFAVQPDIAVFAKGMSNGYAMAAVIGIGSVMDAAQSTFISSTYWTERVGPTAAIATIKEFRRIHAEQILMDRGEAVRRIWREASDESGLPIEQSGIAPLAHFKIVHPEAQALRTFFTQEMLDRGFLASNAFYAMTAHTPEQIRCFETAVHEAFRVVASAADAGDVSLRLRGPVAHTGFKRLA